MVKVGIVILNYNSSEYLKLTLDSLSKAKTNTSFCVGVIDNGSEKRDEIKCREIVTTFLGNNRPIQGYYIASEKNLGFSGGNNIGIRRFFEDPSITHICLLNSDVIVSDSWLDYLLADDLDVTGPVTNAAGNEQTIAIDYSVTLSASARSTINKFAQKRHNIYRDHKNTTDILYFFCTLIKRCVIEKIGMLDEQFFPGSFEDNDYCMRMKEAGFKLTIIRSCFVHHFGSGSFSKLEMSKRIDIANVNKKRFEEKWKTVIKDESWKMALSYRIDIDYLTGKQSDLWAITLLDKSMQGIEKMIDDWASQIAFYQSEQYIAQLLSSHVENSPPVSETLKLANTTIASIPLDSLSGKQLLKMGLIKAFRKAIRILHIPKFSKSKKKAKNVDVNKLVHAISSYNITRKKVVCVFAPMSTKKNERDGYIQRVKDIDTRVLGDYLRIYLHDDGSRLNKLKIDYVDEKKIYVIFNSQIQEQRDQIIALVKYYGILYTHSILPFMTDRIHIGMLALFELKGIKRIWDVHGAVPEEYLLDGSEIGFGLANEVEKYLYNHVEIMIVVTNAMKEHLEKKYGSSKGKVIVLPILNAAVIKTDNCRENIRLAGGQNPTIVYSGGLQKWQNIELMQDVIAQTMEFVNYKIFVPDPFVFKQMWGNRPEKNKFILDTKSPNEIGEEYCSCHYGLVLRDDITVNNVACPTKIIDYIQYGIVPVLKTSMVGDFVGLGMQYINYEDLIVRNLPSEEDRLMMAKNNKDVLRRLVEVGEAGIHKLLSAIEENNLFEFAIMNNEKGIEKDKPAIGLVVGSFDKGGLEQAVFNLYEGYRKLGYESYVLCQSKDIGYFANKLYSSEHLLIFNNNPQLFIDFCLKKKIGLLHYHYNTFMIDKVKKYGIHTIYSIQNIYSWLSDEEIQERAKLINAADYVVAGSTFSKEYYCTRTNTQTSGVEVIPIGVNTKDLDNTKLESSFSRKALGIAKNEITMGFIASFHEVKHQMNMVGAMEGIIKINPNIKLIFVGNIGHPKYFEKVKECWENSIAKNNIIYIPFIDHSQIGEFLRKTIDIFILPTIQEGCSNAVIDALYCGKPMLLTDVGNASDLKYLESVTVVGRAFENLYSFRQSDISKICLEKNCRNTLEIVDGILDIANHLDERNKAAKAAAMKYAEQCDKSTMVKRYTDLIDKIVVRSTHVN